MLYEGAFSTSMTTMSSWTSLDVETEVTGDRTMSDVVHIIRNQQSSMFNLSLTEKQQKLLTSNILCYHLTS